MRRRITLAVGAVLAATVPTAAAVAFASASSRSAQSASYARGSEVAAPRTGALSLRAAPRSRRVLARVGSRTPLGSARRLAIVRERGRWLGVISEELGNGVLGYVRRSEVRLSRNPYVLEADLSQRQLTVRRWGIPCGDSRSQSEPRRPGRQVGASRSPTSSGTSTLRLRLLRAGPVRSSVASAVWLERRGQAGDPRGGGIGTAVSSGCLHADEANLRFLMASVPSGTLVVIHP